MTNDLRKRSLDPELMDTRDVAPHALREALQQLAFINVALGGLSTTRAGLKALVPAEAESFSFLDVGCGSGDTLLAVAKWAKQCGKTVRLQGIELSPVSADMARNRLDQAGIKTLPAGSRAETCLRTTARIEVANLFDLPPSSQFDVVHAALVLHHMADDRQAVQALSHMASLAATGLVVNDLHRHALAHGSIRLLTALFSRNELIRNDAPLSVRRSFTRDELHSMAREAGLTRLEIHWRWAFRWLMIARTEAMGEGGHKTAERADQ